MDPASASDGGNHVPSRSRHRPVSRRRSPQALRRNPSREKRVGIPPASPEVISNLITSFNTISKSSDGHLTSPPPTSITHPPSSLPLTSGPGPSPSPSPGFGSFGVDYGAYASPGHDSLNQPPLSLDELAASPPIVRTSKPPSGFSTLTAPRSPRTPHTPLTPLTPLTPGRDGGSGLRSLIRRSSVTAATTTTTTSPPSPRSSPASDDGDASASDCRWTESATASAHESVAKAMAGHTRDSWGKRMGRNGRGIIHLGSKEVLREKKADKTPSHHNTATPSSNSGPDPGRPSALFADSITYTGPRRESNDSFSIAAAHSSADSSKLIPTRDSSLRKPKLHEKRSSGRRSRKRRDASDGNLILENDECTRGRDGPDTGRSRLDTRSAANMSFLLGPDELLIPPDAKASASRKMHGDTPTCEQEQLASPRDVRETIEDNNPLSFVLRPDRSLDHLGPDRITNRRSGPRSPVASEEAHWTQSASSRPNRLPRPLSHSSQLRAGATSPESTQSVVPTAQERTGSFDSVDDAVQSYLCSPRLSQKIQHPETGRVISFSEVGDASGSAVFCCVGMGLTRYITAFYDELALTLKLRLITPDRPGVGDSEPYSDGQATPLSWPDDVQAICQALKITKFSILAHSAGAIYALATALRMPQQVRGRIHLLAPWIPPSQMSVFGSSQMLPPTNAIPTSQRILRALPTPLLKAANASFMMATTSSIANYLPKNQRRPKRRVNTHAKDASSVSQRHAIPPVEAAESSHGSQFKDRGGTPLKTDDQRDVSESTDNEGQQRVPLRKMSRSSTAPVVPSSEMTADRERQSTYDARLTHAIWGLATTGANPAVDLLVCLERRRSIGFRYVDITRPVVIHHGSRDTRVPVENVKWLGKTMRRCEVRVIEGEGHGLMGSAVVMGTVLMEMSKEWEDWMKATGTDGRRDRERTRRSNTDR